MKRHDVTVVIPVKNGMPLFGEVCNNLKRQNYDGDVRVICIDSGSTDNGPAVAIESGFQLIKIKSQDFGHGRTRNLGASLAQSEYVAFLTHDAIPFDADWLSNLIKPMRMDEKVAGVFSRHIAHKGADPFTKWELETHFAGLADFPVVEIKDRSLYDANIGLQQIYHFYSDNASAMRKSVWQQFPYPDVEFAEDQIWAKTIVEAGYKKAFAYDSVVYHSHSFGPWDTLQRSFDESRAFRVLFKYILCKNLISAFKSGIYLTKRDMGNAVKFGWWRSYPNKTVARLLESFARPIGHYLGSKPALNKKMSAFLSRDMWIKKL
jgi:rhamnosyltransferase